MLGGGLSRIERVYRNLPLLWPQTVSPRGPLEIAVLDVGQGLSIFVRTARHSLLFDAGPAFEDGFDAGAAVVAPYVLGQGLRHIDRLLLSHGDNDHAGGVPSVRRLLNVDREIGTDRGADCADGEQWQWDGVRFTLLGPPAEPAAAGAAGSDNNRSCVLKIDARDIGGFSVLGTARVHYLHYDVDAVRHLVSADFQLSFNYEFR